MSKGGRTLLLGYVGKGNLGDDLMVEAVAQRLAAGSFEIIGGRIPTLRLLGKLLGAERIVVCGGGVVGTRTGSYQKVMALAKLLGVRRIFASIEITGWPKGRRGRLQRWIMRDAAISTRSFESGVIGARAMPTAELTNVMDLFYLHPAFAALPAPGTTVRFGRFTVTAGSGDAGKSERIVVLPRSFPDEAGYPDSVNVRRIVETVARVRELAGDIPVLVSPSADVDDTARYCDALREAGCVVQEAGKDEEVEMSGTDHVVSNRLHIGKTCAFFGIPHTLVSYDRKTEMPELVGSTGEVLQMSGSTVRVADIAMSPAQFEVRRAMSANVLEQSLIR